ncbi:MAG: DUF4105 domain-containing protein [Dokdonella sp.]
MRWILALVVLLSTSVLAQPAAEATSDLEVSLLTFGPGQVYWERFGHNAIVVRDRRNGEATSYNYGIFDFDEDHFIANFARGHMTYQIAANRVEDDIAWYAESGRFVIEQKLRFNATQARALKDFLEWNVKPENVRYRYDYYTQNCSTKVRDALDTALGGSLRQQLVSPSQGYTYRLLTGALTSPQPMLMAGLDLGLGPYADRALSFWDDSFVPMQLMAHLRDIRIVDAAGNAQPLVLEERVIAAGRNAAPPPLPPDLRWPFLAAGVAIASALLILSGRRSSVVARRTFAALAVTISLLCGIAGIVMLALWGFTEHRSAWRNENLLVLSPLCLLLVSGWWRFARSDWKPGVLLRVISLVVALLAGFALFAKVLPWFTQSNVPWILLLLPAHFALAAIARRDSAIE